jgi:hypothetical protein
MDMPRRLRQRPRFKGMPIPYTTFVGKDGSPDFKVNDTQALLRCYQQRLCALCGQKLPEQIVFVGGPISVANRCFIDAAMHEDCALYAVGVCPYLANPHGDYSEAVPKHSADADVHISYYPMTGRPAKMAVYYCKGYEIIIHNEMPILKAWAATKIDWNIIPQREDK